MPFLVTPGVTQWFRVVLIVGVALVVHPLVRRALKSWLSRTRRPMSVARQTTLRSLLGHAVTFIIAVVVFTLILAQFTGLAALLTFLGLFSAGLGLGARPLVSDYLTGFTLIFEDQFSVGEKIEVAGVQGYVENVDLRTTRLRADTGELYIIPNGDVRNIRNFSRASFSPATVTVTVPSEGLPTALARLQHVVQRVEALFPDLVEPPKLLSEHGVVGTTTDLTLVVKAPFGRGPETRTRILELIHAELGPVLAVAAHDPPVTAPTPTPSSARDPLA
ncbi:MAG: mechanosensitive ion channel family protein [Anaerolineae bacterium]|nr:mechanosensitive ion channel family protein [Anaerolineae bacterium]